MHLNHYQQASLPAALLPLRSVVSQHCLEWLLLPGKYSHTDRLQFTNMIFRYGMADMGEASKQSEKRRIAAMDRDAATQNPDSPVAAETDRRD